VARKHLTDIFNTCDVRAFRVHVFRKLVAMAEKFYQSRGFDMGYESEDRRLGPDLEYQSSDNRRMCLN